MNYAKILNFTAKISRKFSNNFCGFVVMIVVWGGIKNNWHNSWHTHFCSLQLVFFSLPIFQRTMKLGIDDKLKWGMGMLSKID